MTEVALRTRALPVGSIGALATGWWAMICADPRPKPRCSSICCSAITTSRSQPHAGDLAARRRC